MRIWISRTARADRDVLTRELRRECQLIVSAVARDAGVRYSDFFARSRMRLRTAGARQLAMYLCHTLLGMTMTQVGQFFGRDRTTVAHACRQIEDERDEGSPCDSRILALEAKIAKARTRRAYPLMRPRREETHHAGN